MIGYFLNAGVFVLNSEKAQLRYKKMIYRREFFGSSVFTGRFISSEG
jgi:hypothetical protein